MQRTLHGVGDQFLNLRLSKWEMKHWFSYIWFMKFWWKSQQVIVQGWQASENWSDSSEFDDGACFVFFLVSLAFFWQNTSDSLLLVGLCRKVDTRKVTGRLVRRQRTGSIFVELAKTRSILREKLRACRKSILGAVGSLRKFSVENTVKGLKKNKHCRIFRKFDFGLNLAKTG